MAKKRETYVSKDDPIGAIEKARKNWENVGMENDGPLKTEKALDDYQRTLIMNWREALQKMEQLQKRFNATERFLKKSAHAAETFLLDMEGEQEKTDGQR